MSIIEAGAGLELPADEVINLDAEGSDAPPVALVDFADRLTKMPGRT